MHELMFQAGVKGMSEQSELISCIYYKCTIYELMFQAGVKGMSEQSELISCIYYKCTIYL